MKVLHPRAVETVFRAVQYPTPPGFPLSFGGQCIAVATTLRLRQPQPQTPVRSHRLPSDRRRNWAPLAAAGSVLALVGLVFGIQVPEPRPIAGWQPNRHNILDADGRIFATSIETDDVVADQRLVPTYTKRVDGRLASVGVAGAAADLAPILGLPVADVVEKLTGTARFTYVARKLSKEDGEAVARLGIPGVALEVATLRWYPAGEVGASVVGFLGKDGTPLSGAEKVYDDQLRREPLQLTIEQDLQGHAQQLLSDTVEQTGARSADAIVMDIQTGAVRALATTPSFDANNPGAAPAQDRVTRPLIDVFPAGSIASLATVAAAMQERKLPPGVDIASVVAHPTAAGMAEIGGDLSSQTLSGYLTLFGFGVRSGIGLPESPGIFPRDPRWSTTQKTSIMTGVGVSVTTQQVADVIATIANGGRQARPHIVVSGAPDVPAAERVVRTDVAAQLLSLLTETGSQAEAASIPGSRLVGLAGTTPAYDETCRCFKGVTATFAGLTPARNPTTVIVVVVHRPLRQTGGVEAALPVFRSLANEVTGS